MNIDVQNEKNELEEFKDLTGKVTVAMADVLATLHQKNIEYLGTIEYLQSECKRLEEEKRRYEEEFAKTLQNTMGSHYRFQQERFDKMVEYLEEWTEKQHYQINTMQSKQEKDYELYCNQMNEAWKENVQPLKTLHGWLFEQKKKLISELEELKLQQKEYDNNIEKLKQDREKLDKERIDFEREKKKLPNIEFLQEQLRETEKTNEILLDEKNRLKQQIGEYEETCKELKNQNDTLTSNCDNYKEQYETMSQEAERNMEKLNQYKTRYGQLEDRKGVDRYGE